MGFINAFKNYWKETGAIYARNFKRIVITAPFWILAASIALSSTGIIRYMYLLDARNDQYMAEFWGEGSEVGFRQLSVYARGIESTGEYPIPLYMNNGTSLKKGDINTIRTSLQTVVDSSRNNPKDKGLTDDGSPRGWTDCYSTFFSTVMRDADIEGDIKDSDWKNVEIVAVGGDYRAFHPFIYMSGGFLPATCVDIDQIVLSDSIAWTLFGSYDIIGERVVLADREFIVSGVVREQDSAIDREVGTDAPRAYIYFNALEAIARDSGATFDPNADTSNLSAGSQELLSGAGSTGSEGLSTTSECAILCYEAMLPELVKGVANTDIKSAIPGYTEADPKFFIVSNTGRFNVLKVWDFNMPLGENSEKLRTYNFPYWERASQTTMMHLFVDIILVLAGAVLLIIGIVTSVLRWHKKPLVIEKKTDDDEDEEEKLLLEAKTK